MNKVWVVIVVVIVAIGGVAYSLSQSHITKTGGGPRNNSGINTTIAHNETSNLTIVQDPPPFQDPAYLESPVGPSYSCGDKHSGFEPCFGGNLSTAVVFNCASAAASPQGCAATVVSSYNSSDSYNVTVWYPYTWNTTERNCDILPESWHTTQEGGTSAWCSKTGPSSFVASIPTPPPPT